jgi:hypothetical protein
LNEDGLVINFAFTKTESLQEASQMLANVKTQCPEIEMVVADTCCNNRKLLNDTFDVPIKLDVFHSLNRVIRQIKSGDLLEGPDGRGQRTKFIREVRLIVRQRHDQGDKRSLKTANADEIKCNITELLSRWNDKLKKEIVKELTTLRDKHSVCMSAIPVGVGTHMNERLHAKIRSSQHDIKLMSLQMQVALLQTLFYRQNQKIRPNCDQRALVDLQSKYNQNPPVLSFDQGFGIMPGNIMVAVTPPNFTDITSSDIETAKTMLCLLKNVVPSSLNYQSVEILCCCPFLDPSVLNVSADPGKESTMHNLISDLGLEVLMQSHDCTEVLNREVENAQKLKDNEQYIEHGNYILSQSWNDLIAEELNMNNDEYCQSFSSDDVFSAYKLKLKDSTCIPDMSLNCTMHIYANILRSTVILLSPSSSPIQTIHPTSALQNKHPIIIATLKQAYFALQKKTGAYNIDSDATLLTNENTDVSCTCGKGRASSKLSCMENGRCPCVKQNKSCVNCKCVSCGNKSGGRFTKELAKSRSCRCGEGSTDGSTEHCSSLRCECIKRGYSCMVAPVCRCKNCGNEHGAMEKEKINPKRELSERNALGCSAKKARTSTSAMMTENNLKMRQSIWSDRETILLHYCQRRIKNISNRMDTKMIHNMFNTLKENVDETIRAKSLVQVTYKLMYFKRYSNVYKNTFT